MTAPRLNRRQLLASGAAVSCAGLIPSLARAAPVAGTAAGPITDMTMNAPSYAEPIGFGRQRHVPDGIDPLGYAFGG